MAPPDARSPADRWHGGRAQEDDLAGRLITSEYKPSLPERQAAYVERRFQLPAAIARTVAALHFDGSPA